MRYAAERDESFIQRVIKALGPKALLAWSLLLVVAFSMTSGLTDAVANLSVAYVFSIAAVGMTLGWLLSLLPMKAWLGATLSLLLGFEFLLIRVGGLEDEVLRIVGATTRLVPDAARWYWTSRPPDWGGAFSLFLELWRGMGTLLARTGMWLGRLLAGSEGFDVVGTALVWGFGVWVYNVWAGWVVRRYHRPLLGVLPGSVLLAFALSYTGANPYIFLPIVGVTLVLMAMMHQTEREHRWSIAGIDFSQGLWSDIAMISTGISIALVLAAAIAPSISAQKIADWVREVTDRGEETRTETVAEGLGLQQRPAPRPARPVESARSTGLPQRHLIGSGPELSRVVVMVVQTGELPPVFDSQFMERVPRHYWRSITYDRYFGRGWATSNTESIDYEAGEAITEVEADHLRPLRQTVRIVNPDIGGIIHVDGTLVSVDQDFNVTWRSGDEIFAATTEAETYRADSVYPVVSAEELRSASQDYPEAILSRYLQLPDSVPERVRTLARDLTAVEPTPYDRAVAIEQYLRQFPYTLDVPSLGPTEDIADYFLFELQEGYCDYYASSMVVLARAAGLPARLVIGYVSGSYDPIEARYVVTEADAHSWPEIYFPGYGWIEFEPTGGRAPIEREAAPDELIWPEGSEPVGPLVTPEASGGQPLIIAQWVLIGVAGLLGVIAVGAGADSLWLLLGSPEGMTRRLMRRLRAYARRLRTPHVKGNTPDEVAGAMGDRLRIIAEAHGYPGVELVEPAVEEVQDLVSFYTDTWYRRDPDVSPRRRRGAVLTWWRLRWRLWLAWLWRRSAIPVEPGAKDDEA
ncbi:MAG: transglutaminase domain-containing protein [Anaerolineae bacterium]